MGMIQAPAKINLTLEVLGKRSDGFHEIRSVLQSINLSDVLYFNHGKRIIVRSETLGWSVEQSLIAKAARFMQEIAPGSPGAVIEIEKRIPLMSGLGGDSSDAAATLRGLNELWQLDLSREKLVEMAGQLGSDAAFFLYEGTAMVEGRGERVTPLQSLPGMWVVLVVPDVPRLPGKTGKMYTSLKPAHFTDGRITDNLAKALKEGKGFEPSMLFNTFENVAYEDSTIRAYKEHLVKLGASQVHLSGSGPTLFSIFKDKAQAEDLFAHCKQQGMEAYLAETIGQL
jgi:4-diphosphocytidyl-2-C-methyl-D-erythritol kinase